jgi:nicotinamide-nucleotide amidase
MRAAILSVGSEILRGDILDTNAPFLARELSEMGFEVAGIRAAGDDLVSLTEAIRQSLHDADVLLVSGGLGPTEDDLTRDALARIFDEEVTEDPELMREIEERFARLGRRSVPDNNRRQAQLIPSATSVPNPNGTAPGWLVRKAGKLVATMPGPPSEMQPMWRDSIRPQVERLLPSNVAMRALMTFGIGESALEEQVSDIIHLRPDVIVATYAKENGVQVHVTARAATSPEAERSAGETESMLRKRLGRAVFGTGDTTLAAAIGALCLQQGVSLGVMESATGGMIGALITSHPGSSEYFRGSIVSYATDIKVRYGVPQEVVSEFGAVSSQTAAAMASAARTALGSTAGLGLTGITGTYSIDGHPPGTCFIAVETDDTTRAAEIHRPGARATAQRFFAQSALNLLRLALMRSEVHA